MRYGICPLSLVPVYESPDAASAMLTQLLYGEAYKLLETRKKWGRIRTEWDGTEGWIRADQHFEIGEAQYKSLDNDGGAGCASDLVDHTTAEGGLLQPILLGSQRTGPDLSQQGGEHPGGQQQRRGRQDDEGDHVQEALDRAARQLSQATGLPVAN